MAKAKPHCRVCGYDMPELFGYFAMFVLAELKADPYWKNRLTGLASMFLGESENPL